MHARLVAKISGKEINCLGIGKKWLGPGLELIGKGQWHLKVQFNDVGCQERKMRQNKVSGEKRGKTAVLGVPVGLFGASVTQLFPVSTQFSLYPEERSSRFL